MRAVRQTQLSSTRLPLPCGRALLVRAVYRETPRLGDDVAGHPVVARRVLCGAAEVHAGLVLDEEVARDARALRVRRERDAVSRVGVHRVVGDAGVDGDVGRDPRRVVLARAAMVDRVVLDHRPAGVVEQDARPRDIDARAGAHIAALQMDGVPAQHDRRDLARRPLPRAKREALAGRTYRADEAKLDPLGEDRARTRAGRDRDGRVRSTRPRRARCARRRSRPARGSPRCPGFSRSGQPTRHGGTAERGCPGSRPSRAATPTRCSLTALSPCPAPRRSPHRRDREHGAKQGKRGRDALLAPTSRRSRTAKRMPYLGSARTPPTGAGRLQSCCAGVPDSGRAIRGSARLAVRSALHRAGRVADSSRRRGRRGPGPAPARRAHVGLPVPTAWSRPLASVARVVAPGLPGLRSLGQAAAGRGLLLRQSLRVDGRLVDELELRRLTVVVQDWGGPIGLRLAVERPELVERLVILNTGHRRRPGAFA